MKKAYLTIICLIFTFSLFSCEEPGDTSLDESSADTSSVTSVSTASDTSSTDSNNQKLLLYKTTYINSSYTETYDYNQWGAISVIIGESNDGIVQKTEFQYDDNKNLIKEIRTDSEGKTTYIKEIFYDENNNIIKEEEQNKGLNIESITTYSYDGENRITEMQINGVKKIYTYVQDGSYTVTSDTNAGINYYDKDGKQTESVLDKSRALYIYDENGNLLEEKGYNDGELIYFSVYTYGDYGNLLEKSVYRNEELIIKVIYEYDENGNNVKIKTVNPLGIESIAQEMEYKLFSVTVQNVN